jgi:hypothetical protein
MLPLKKVTKEVSPNRASSRNQRRITTPPQNHKTATPLSLLCASSRTFQCF